MICVRHRCTHQTSSSVGAGIWSSMRCSGVVSGDGDFLWSEVQDTLCALKPAGYTTIGVTKQGTWHYDDQRAWSDPWNVQRHVIFSSVSEPLKPRMRHSSAGANFHAWAFHVAFFSIGPVWFCVCASSVILEGHEPTAFMPNFSSVSSMITAQHQCGSTISRGTWTTLVAF